MWISLRSFLAPAFRSWMLRSALLLVFAPQPLGALYEPPTSLTALQPAASACPHNCTGRGRCTANVCACFAGWGGASCGEDIGALACPTSCSGHGWCSGRGQVCICEEFWRGPQCEAPSRCANGCSGFGECVDGSFCRCDADHFGADCSRPIARCPGWPGAACGGPSHGVCTDAGTCLCRPEFHGAACERSTAFRACRHNCTWPHGVCDPEGSGRCLCGTDWEGAACERRLGALSFGELLLRFLCGVLIVAAIGTGALLAWFLRVRGVQPRDVLRGQLHIRKEEGWARDVAEGQLAGARFERFGEWSIA